MSPWSPPGCAWDRSTIARPPAESCARESVPDDAENGGVVYTPGKRHRGKNDGEVTLDRRGEPGAAWCRLRRRLLHAGSRLRPAPAGRRSLLEDPGARAGLCQKVEHPM